MKKFCPLITFTLVLTCAISSIHAQDSCQQEDGNFSSAYVESSHAAHWSVYIPIAILVGAAIWFGFADKDKDKGEDSNNSQDALGSIANSKRISSSDSYKPGSYRSKTLPFKSYRPAKMTYGSYAHNN